MGSRELFFIGLGAVALGALLSIEPAHADEVAIATDLDPSIPHSIEKIHDVPGFQKYIAKIGLDAQVKLLSSTHGYVPAEIDRIQEIIKLTNEQAVAQPLLADKVEGPEKLRNLAKNIQDVLTQEVVRGMNSGKPALGA